MKRRGFLGFMGGLVAAPFLVNAKLVGDPVAELPPATGPNATIAVNSLARTTSVRDGSGKAYQMIQARRGLKAGDVVCIEEGKPFGVAVATISKDHYGFVQIGGPAVVKMTTR